MKDLLSNQDKRYLLILEELSENNNSSYQNLASLTGVSANTIREDIKVINKLIVPLHISFNPYEKSVYLIKYDDISTDFIYSCIIKNSLEFNVLEMIFFEEYVRLEDYAEKNFISVSTLKRTISKLNKTLASKNIRISTNPIQLIGDEKSICLLIAYLLREKYIEFDYPFKEIDTLTLDRLLLSSIGNKLNFNNFQDMRRLKLLMMVSIVRIKNKHYITKDYDKFNLTTYDVDFLDDVLYKHYFKSTFQIDLTYNNLIELLYLFLPKNFATDYQELTSICKSNLTQQKKLKEHISLLDDISTSLNLPLNYKEELILDLFNIRLLEVSQDYLLHNDKLEFYKELSKEAPLVLSYLNDKISKHFIVTMLTDYEKIHFIYMLITHWEGLFIEIQKNQPIFDVGVFMTSDKEHSTFITQTLNDKFQGKFTFHSIEAVHLEDCFEEFSKYKFIVTNTTQLNMADHTLINIGLYPSSDDVSVIDSIYLKLINDNY